MTLKSKGTLFLRVKVTKPPLAHHIGKLNYQKARNSSKRQRKEDTTMPNRAKLKEHI